MWRCSVLLEPCNIRWLCVDGFLEYCWIVEYVSVNRDRSKKWFSINNDGLRITTGLLTRDGQLSKLLDTQKIVEGAKIKFYEVLSFKKQYTNRLRVPEKLIKYAFLRMNVYHLPWTVENHTMLSFGIRERKIFLWVSTKSHSIRSILQYLK